MRRSLLVSARLVMVALAITASAARAEAITLREIVDLTRAGLSDEVLLALIEVDQRVFAIDPATLKSLKDAGVSPAVIVAIVKSGRMPQPQPEPVVEIQPSDPPPPQVVVVDRPRRARGARRCPGVRCRRRSIAYTPPRAGVRPPRPRRCLPFGLHGASQAERPQPPRRAEPVYWGWGGKLRPDAWQPTPNKDDRSHRGKK